MNDFKDKNNDYWRNKLTDEQFAVCRLKKTESPGSGEYEKHFQDGIYSCVACGQGLFSSDAKYDSGSGWPSFFKPLPGKTDFTEDSSLGLKRVEVLCSNCGSHLGHVFEDGPKPTGKRYCINSVALSFRKN